MTCPNCGFVSNVGLSRCGCTWDEKAEATKIKEARRRRELRKQGKSVLVDHQNDLYNKNSY